MAGLLASGVPFIRGFARSAPVKARLARLSPQQRRWLAAGGAVRLGGCPWDDRLRLFALGARSPTDKRGPSVYLTSLRAAGPQRLVRAYRQRWRVEQAIEELLHGNDLDHLVGTRLHPNRAAIGLPIALAGARPARIREPAAFRALHLDALGTFTVAGRTVLLACPHASPGQVWRLPWTGLTVRSAA